MVAIRTQPMINPIFANQLNSYHAAIEIGRRIVVLVFFRDVRFDPICPAFGAVFEFCDVDVVQCDKK